jgi:hypothetical protein
MDPLSATENSIGAIVHTGYSLWLAQGSRRQARANLRKILQPADAARWAASNIEVAARISPRSAPRGAVVEM